MWTRRSVRQVRGAQLRGVGPAQPLPGVRSDEPSQEDLLETSAEVAKLATLAASLTTEPPLSIALLGEWGSGKSSPTLQMQEAGRLADLSRRNLGQSSFAASVKKVHFNAWHYSDDHLWPGLVEYLFRGLAHDDPAADPDPAEVRTRRERLAAELDRRTAERDRLTKDLRSEWESA